MEGGIVTPVMSAEMKVVLLERLKNEILSKLGGGSLCRSSRSVSGSVSNRNNRSGRKRRIESQSENPASGSNGNGVATTTSNNEKGDKGTVDQLMNTAESVVRSRFIVGINRCTRILESAIQQQKQQNHSISNPATHSKPSLILLARDVRPATILAHISLYAHLLKIPICILPGKASLELGKAVGVRSVIAAVFLSSSSSSCCDGEEEGAAAMIVSKEENLEKEREWKEVQNDVDSFVKYVISKIPK